MISAIAKKVYCQRCGKAFRSYQVFGGHVRNSSCDGGTVEQRFNALVQRTKDCWFWTGAKNVDGYGVINRSGKILSAHRTAWELTHGKIPVGMHVLHRCNVRNCVNPKHLRLGTHQDNMQDKVAAGTSLRGESAPRAKLTTAQVIEIRALRGKMLQKDIAKKFAIDPTNVSNIWRRHIWKHVA